MQSQNIDHTEFCLRKLINFRFCYHHHDHHQYHYHLMVVVTSVRAVILQKKASDCSFLTAYQLTNGHLVAQKCYKKKSRRE